MGPIADLAAHMRTAAEPLLAEAAQWAVSSEPSRLPAAVAAAAALLILIIASLFLAKRSRALIEVIPSDPPLAKARSEPTLGPISTKPHGRPAPPRRNLTRGEATTIAAPISSTAPRPPAPRPPPRAELIILPLRATSAEQNEHRIAEQIGRRLEAVLGEVAPELTLIKDPISLRGSTRTALPRYQLSGTLLHMGDRLRIAVEMSDVATGSVLFRFRYQSLPSEQELILAELVRRILKATEMSTRNDQAPTLAPTKKSLGRHSSPLRPQTLDQT